MTELEEKIVEGIRSVTTLMANVDMKLIEELILDVEEDAQVEIAKNVEGLIVMLQPYVKQ